MLRRRARGFPFSPARPSFTRPAAGSRPTALALFAIVLVVDGGLLVGMMESWTGAAFVMIGLSYLTKLCACAFGGGYG